MTAARPVTADPPGVRPTPAGTVAAHRPTPATGDERAGGAGTRTHLVAVVVAVLVAAGVIRRVVRRR